MRANLIESIPENVTDDHKNMNLKVDSEDYNFDQIYTRFGDAIYTYLLHQILDREVANDLFQETFLRVINAMQRRRGSYTQQGRWLGWVMRIARNATLDHLRSRKKWQDVSASGDEETGGGPRFLEFIHTELKPLIEAEYPADPADATIFGDSFGGLFSTFVLLNRPHTFQRYIIGSPSLFWNDKVLLEHERRGDPEMTEAQAYRRAIRRHLRDRM